MEPEPSTGRTAALPGPCSRWPAEQGETIRQIIDRAGNKWAVLVVGSLHAGPLRYTDLLRSIPGVSQRMLTHTLRQLRRDGLVTRTAYPEVPPRVEYALTDLGETLLIAITTLIDWAGTHHDEIQENRARFDETEAAV
ncbi:MULTISPECIES: winged helix-turn-helix transcriptional regulator [Rhodococcus]|uniref:winged helix-turn-helix transcriptional regulator n=1 Tax=Rhodococcus TaxID=1827 RepID=UPI00102110B5|nr:MULTISPECIES: helix-turn-helix domain-containing protein [Rhodococcus]UTT46782.1 helix-turn-helix transcriptional regulator [Rhodococcus gordoniae]BDB61041.1 HxlR family transcriptional regulator [Rhodococcus sp. RDE2]